MGQRMMPTSETDLERRIREALEALAAMPPEQRPAPHRGPSRFAPAQQSAPAPKDDESDDGD